MREEVVCALVATVITLSVEVAMAWWVMEYGDTERVIGALSDET